MSIEIKISEDCAKRKSEERSDHVDLGTRGENAACDFLIAHGMDILERNWRCPAGEVDIIAKSPGALHFVEVKTRRGTGSGFPEEAVDSRKRHRYECIAEYYLRDYETTDIAVRFDVVAIVVTAPDRGFLRFEPNAFYVGC
ncbi:MAG: YraN family protein [Coriobacteriaceae bacterium]|nr:YraN family protein [Coriobacteriaceae bacterium]MDO4890817.1 YraN family protein [Coriobacteriaceae bacterium]